MGDWCNNIAKEVDVLIQNHKIDHVVVEDFFFSSRFASGCSVNSAYRTAIHMTVRSLSLPYTILNISQWKSFIAGRSVPTKDQKKKWGAERAKKLFIQQALWDRYKIRFPNHSLSSKTGKPILFRYDIVDAVGQALCFCKLHMNAVSVTFSTSFPADIDWGKKAPKHQIDYTN